MLAWKAQGDEAETGCAVDGTHLVLINQSLHENQKQCVRSFMGRLFIYKSAAQIFNLFCRINGVKYYRSPLFSRFQFLLDVLH